MSNALLLLPDFLLIVVGFVLCRFTALNRPVWEAAERLVYYVLFPVLLFNSILKSPLQPAQTISLAAASVGTVACGIVLSLSLKHWPGVDARLHASGARKWRSASTRSSRWLCRNASAGRRRWPGRR